MRLYRTERGLARGDGDQLLLLDLPHRDVGKLLTDDPNVVIIWLVDKKGDSL